MAGQSAMLTRKESIALQRSVECGPNKTTGGTDPNRGKEGMNVKVPTK